MGSGVAKCTSSTHIGRCVLPAAGQLDANGLGRWIHNRRSAGVGVALEERAVDRDGRDGQAGRVHRARAGGQRVRVLAKERRGCSHCSVLCAVCFSRVTELPPLGLSGDPTLRWFVGLQPGSRKDSTVVCTTRPRTMFVDRAGVIDQHRTMSLVVVAEHDMSARQSGRGEQQRRIDVGKRVGFIGADVNELR